MIRSTILSGKKTPSDSSSLLVISMWRMIAVGVGQEFVATDRDPGSSRPISSAYYTNVVAICGSASLEGRVLPLPEDVSHSTRRRKSLRHSAERLRTARSKAPDSVYVCVVRSSRIMNSWRHRRHRLQVSERRFQGISFAVE
jgi:hypothetical protein